MHQLSSQSRILTEKIIFVLFRHELDFGEKEFEQVAARRISEKVKLVDNDDAEFVEAFFFQKSVDEAVGLFDGAHGHVDGFEAAGRMVAAHEAANAMWGVSEKYLPLRHIIKQIIKTKSADQMIASF